MRAGGRDRERSRDRGQSGDRHRERERQRQKEKDSARARTGSMERGLDEDYLERGHGREGSQEGWTSCCFEEEDEGERRARGRQRVQSNPEEVFEESRGNEGRGDARDLWDPRQGEGPSKERSHSHPSAETGTTVSLPLGSVWVCVVC